MACSYPWQKLAPVEPVGERTRFGSAFHEGMEWGLTKHAANPESWKVQPAVARKWRVDHEELQARIDAGFPVLRKWLAGENSWNLAFPPTFLRTEVSVAYNPETGEARETTGPSEEKHEYLDVSPLEIPGTGDLVAVIETRKTALSAKFKTVLVLDHKSGWSVAADWQPRTPAENGQLRTLATAFAALYQADHAIVAFFHAPADGLPEVYADEMNTKDFEEHRLQLKGAMRRIGNGWLRPGDHCAYCPAWRICPTTTTSLTVLQRAGGPLTSQRVGAVHAALQEFNRLGDKLRDEIRAWVETNGPGERPDGALVDLVDKDVERLSKASVLKALGPLKGAKLLESLRQAGALETKTQRELRAVRR